MSSNRPRPLSPHLTIWRWGPGMAVSIMHRAAGVGMATVGAILLVWWLVAAASGEAAYDSFVDIFTYKNGSLNILGYLFGIGLTATFFQHMGNGIRHFFMDIGANYELKGNKLSAQATWVFAVVATILYWGYLLGVKG
ncbi:succinate dehydrogenase cytochrome b556 subunit [Sphingomonas changbaiensis NBRC 104936]|uniref:Succinate dehydrogenase cytochrome b556 subunit n=1 Tax=Sphingomonas changbaiensis NBRC 104936 TaxID=1219043 RepID=A0A0E9MPG7_9SPHN|nr:succinate dehydrogenase, cytochrome b556 subunit [Sphingomonas changbaiensis]GAO39434.1 succinate dehydrogenase cytochrome b556 subunit [Sphingomonas changbaiensis NBRC 104936]